MKARIVASAIVLAATNIAAQTKAPDTSAIVAELRNGRYADAEAMTESALKASSGSAPLWTLDGIALSHLGRDKDALVSYERALKLSPDYLPALEGAAQIEFAASDQRAVPILKRIVERKPADETSHAMLATLAFKRKDCQTAAAEFRLSRKAIDTEPRSLEQFGSCLLDLKQTDEALPVFQRVAELRPETEEAQYNLGIAELAAKKYKDAVSTFQKLVTRKPNDADDLDLLAEAYEGAQDTPNAVATLRQAIVTNPDVARYYLDFAEMCMTHTAYKVGIDMLSAGLQRLPTAAALYLARGILYVQVDDYENSRRDFDRAEQLDPKMEYGQGMKELAELQQNQLPQAESDVRSRLRKSPKDAFLWYLLSETLVREGAKGTPAFEEAVSSAERAIALRANFPLARNLLARLYLQEGKARESVAQSRLALEEAPSGETAATALYHLIQALKRDNGDPAELQSLSKKLADLLQNARDQQASERKYVLVEGDAPRPGKP